MRNQLDSGKYLSGPNEGGTLRFPKYIGKRFSNINARERVTGEIKFPSDIRFPGLLEGKLLRSPHAHAKILSIDTSKAEKLKGVKAVITSADFCPTVRMGFTVFDRPVLAMGKVRFIGEPIAAVAAVDEDIAKEAVERIRVEYELLPAVFDSEEAMTPGAPNIHDVERNIVAIREELRGDITQGFESADFIFEDRFSTPAQEHAPLETEANVVKVDFMGNLECWLSTHSIFWMRSLIAAALDIPEKRVHVIVKGYGGDFGGKSQTNLSIICAGLAKKAGFGEAVRLTYTREEEFVNSTIRHPSVVYLKTGVKTDGMIVSRHAKYILNMGAYVDTGDAIVQWAGVNFTSTYKAPNLKFEGYSVYTNLPVGGSFRGFGNPQMAFAVESQIDMIAERLGIDPVDLRLKNASETGDELPCGWRLKSCGLKECLSRVSRSPHWKAGKEKRKLNKTSKVKYGVGMACGTHGSGWKAGFMTRVGMSDTDPSTSSIKIEGDGAIRVFTGELDYGTGSNTGIAQIVAEELGARFEDVQVIYGETDIVPYGKGPYSSRTLMMGGMSAKLAASKVKKQLLQIAAKMWESDLEDLEIENGSVFMKQDPKKSISIADLAYRAYMLSGNEPIIGTGFYDHKGTVRDPKTNKGSIAACFLFMALGAVVAVDSETGQIEVSSIISANDCGRVINPTLCEGQTEGACAQGMGYALLEEIKYSEGKNVNANLRDYKIPTALDMPPIECIFVESYEPDGPFGAKGVAEHAMVASAGAIANAVYDAIGVRIKSLPITPEKVLKALTQQKEKQ
jgi:CO/xanthine dehydrogenase Mo-binding subunit